MKLNDAMKRGSQKQSAVTARATARVRTWALTVILLPLLLSGCAAIDATERLAALWVLETESAARLLAEGEVLYKADASPISATSYKAQDGATALIESGELRRGVREASKALFLGQTAGPALVAIAKRDLAYAYSLAGDLDRAQRFAVDALREAEPVPEEWFFPARRAQVLGPANKILGDILLRQGRWQQAIQAYETALQQGDAAFAPYARVSLANAYLAGGNAQRAEVLFRQETASDDSELASLVARGLGYVALAQGQADEAVRRFMQAAAGAAGEDRAYHRLWALDGLARAHRMAGRPAAALSAYQDALATAEAVRARFRSEEFKTGFFGEVQRIFDDAVQALMEAGQTGVALDASEKGRARALLDLVRGRVSESAGAMAFAAAHGKTVDSRQLQAALPRGVALIEYHLLEDRAYVWRIRRDGLAAVTLPVGRAVLAAETERYRQAIRDRVPEVTALGEALYDRLIAPIGLVPGDRLIIVPHDVLHYLPFHALSGPAGYLIQQHELSYAPSATVALELASATAGQRQTIFAAGNPDLGSPRLALPAAEREIKQIRELFPDADAYLGKAATKTRVLAGAPAHAIVHLAAHARVDPIDPLYSTILLAPTEKASGLLEAHEVYQMDLRESDLAVLSACETGLGRVSRGDELWGFTRAFLSAGARTLVVSLWAVNDESTARTMGVFYRGIKSAGVGAALRAAQLQMLGERDTAHPYYWAPFVMVGDWR